MKASYKGIPQQARKAVRSYVAVMASNGKQVSPQTAYRSLKAGWKKQAADKAAQQAADLSVILKRQHDSAVADIGESLQALSNIRDLLLRMADGSPEQVSRFGGMDIHDFAAMAHAYMEKHGKQLEMALYLLDIVKGGKWEGWFAETFPKKILNK